MGLISIDIGSTYTKGVLFSINGNELTAVRRGVVPTTRESLFTGFSKLLTELCGTAFRNINPADYDFHLSSSAKGGLTIAALGIVPDLTMKMARMTALSAGGRICSLFSYKLTKSDIKKLEAENPDIILFTGGTDGGNEDYILKNGEMLAGSDVRSTIIYAGNRSMVDQITEILGEKDLVLAGNVLPDLDTPNPQDARKRIRELFLSKITHGKGLSGIAEWTGTELLPTPYTVYEYLKLFPRYSEEWSSFCLIDMGGATTDYYSLYDDRCTNAEVIVRGIREPRLKRSVEGDLGMRVSAMSVPAAAPERLSAMLSSNRLDAEGFDEFLEKISSRPGYLPGNGKEKLYDGILAAVCVSTAAERHAGRLENVFTSEGSVSIQRGKNLMPVRKLIGSGGFLSSRRDFNPLAGGGRIIDQNGRRILIPENPEYFIDVNYNIPILANIASVYPEAAVRYGVKELKKGKAETFPVKGR